MAIADQVLQWEPYMKDVTKRLRRLLGCLRTAPHFESCMEKFENKVLPAARKIQENMVLSMDKYSFSIEKFEQTENRRARIERLLKNHGAEDLLEGIRKDEYHDVLRALRFIPVESTVKDELDELCKFLQYHFIVLPTVSWVPRCVHSLSNDTYP